MIIVDFSQILIAAASAGFSQFGDELDEHSIRHMFLNSLLGIKQKHIKKYGGPIILACDGDSDYWRKSIFPYYKIKRANARKTSAMDWNLIFNTLDKLYDEINEHFLDYHVIKVDGLEGDDIISVLVHYLNENDFIQDGVMERRQDIIILSADEDFLQLQAYGNVSQWSPIKKKFIRSGHPLNEKYEKIIRGDRGDGIVNIFSADDCFALNKRQSPATKKKIEPILNSLIATGQLPEDIDPTVKRNFDRNKKLIDLVDLQLPEKYYDEVIKLYKDALLVDSSEAKSKLFNYFVKNKLPQLFTQIDKF